MKIEPGGGVKALHSGVIYDAMPSTTIDVIIPEVNLAKTIAKISYGTDTNNANGYVSIRLLDASTVRMERYFSATKNVIRWEVIEYV